MSSTPDRTPASVVIKKPSTLHTKPSTLSHKASTLVNSEKGFTLTDDAKAGVVIEPLSSTESVAHKGPIAKFLIITCLCSAVFFDVFNATSAITSLPKIGETLNMGVDTQQWVLSAYTLTYGAFQVPAGRLSDIYGPKPIFSLGFLGMGLACIVCAPSVHPIMLIVFRAVSGLGAALTVPPALSMIVRYFPDPADQRTAFAGVAMAGGLGNSVGVIIGGSLTARVGWRWVYYVTAMVTVPLAILAWIFLPPLETQHKEKRGLDFPGVGVLTAGLILLVYALSDGNTDGWKSPQVLATLIISIVLLIAFFGVERLVKDPAVPPSMWFGKNFLALFFYTWSPYWWFFGAELTAVQLWQDQWHWSPLSAAVHAIPFGLGSATMSFASNYFLHRVPRRYLMIGAQFLMIGAGILLVYGCDDPSKYWSHNMTGSFLGLAGVALSYVTSSIAMMETAQEGEQGVLGGVMYTAYQVGATIGIAIVTAVALGTTKRAEDKARGVPDINGYKASFWSLVGMNAVEALIAVFFIKD